MRIMTYYQPVYYHDDGTNIDYTNIPDRLASFQAFATKEDCEEWLRNYDYDPRDFAIITYQDDDIEDVTILDGDGNIVDAEDDTPNWGEDDDNYFSEGLYNLIMGKITAEEFRATYGDNVCYDALNGIINLGNNTIITNTD